MKVKSCSDFGKECKHATFRAGISRSLTSMMGIPHHPHPTMTCHKIGVEIRRDSAQVKPLPMCRGKFYEPKGAE